MNLGDVAPDVVVDGGPAPLREPSTVVLAVAGEIRVVREGSISVAKIAEAVRHAGASDPVSGPNAPHAV
jgi:tRNA A37 threonylcarbamoyladenosine synthetase subunit TsaC/SUA5/YrdC